MKKNLLGFVLAVMIMAGVQGSAKVLAAPEGDLLNSYLPITVKMTDGLLVDTGLSA